MTSRADVDRLSEANRRIVEMARRDLDRLWQSLDGLDPESRLASLLEYVPVLVREYGNLAGVASAQWYEDLRARSAADSRFRALTGPTADPDAVTGSVRHAARSLFGEDPAGFLAVLSGSLQRHILYSSRETVARNVRRDPAKPRYARVPSGAKTCAWCEMLASRGWVYMSEARAGGDKDWHDDCDCQIVPEWDAENAHIEGYDPDAMYERYQEAVKVAGGDQKDIVAALRRLYPDQFTDGVKPKVD